MIAHRYVFAGLAMALGAVACGAAQTAGPIPGQDPIVGRWHHPQLGVTTFTPEGTFLPDERFANKCVDDPRVREEKEKCASGTWTPTRDGAYAVVLPNFKQVGQDGASDCKCHAPIHVMARVSGNTLEMSHGDGRPVVVFDRR